MRFRSEIPADPKNGDSTMWKGYFCLLPRRIGNYIVWLEWAQSRKIFMVRQRATKAGPITAGAWEREFRLAGDQ